MCKYTPEYFDDLLLSIIGEETIENGRQEFYEEWLEYIEEYQDNLPRDFIF